MKKIAIISVIIGLVSFSALAQTTTTSPSKLHVEKKVVTRRSSVSKAIVQSKTQTTTAPENTTSENSTTNTPKTTQTVPANTKCQQSTSGTTNTNCAKKCQHSGIKCNTPYQNVKKANSKTVIPNQ